MQWRLIILNLFFKVALVSASEHISFHVLVHHSELDLLETRGFLLVNIRIMKKTLSIAPPKKPGVRIAALHVDV